MAHSAYALSPVIDEAIRKRCPTEIFSQDPTEKFSRDLGLRHLIRLRVRPSCPSQPPNPDIADRSQAKICTPAPTTDLLILLQDTFVFQSYFYSPSQAPTMTTRPSRKAPSSLLASTKASSARTRSSSRLKSRTTNRVGEDSNTCNVTMNGAASPVDDGAIEASRLKTKMFESFDNIAASDTLPSASKSIVNDDTLSPTPATDPTPAADSVSPNDDLTVASKLSTAECAGTIDTLPSEDSPPDGVTGIVDNTSKAMEGGTVAGTGIGVTGGINEASKAMEIVAVAGAVAGTAAGVTAGTASTKWMEAVDGTGIVARAVAGTVAGAAVGIDAPAFTTPATAAVTLESTSASTKTMTSPSPKNLYSIFASKTPSKSPILTPLGKTRVTTTKAHDPAGDLTPSDSKHPANESNVPFNDMTKTITMSTTASSKSFIRTDADAAVVATVADSSETPDVETETLAKATPTPTADPGLKTSIASTPTVAELASNTTLGPTTPFKPPALIALGKPRAAPTQPPSDEASITPSTPPILTPLGKPCDAAIKTFAANVSNLVDAVTTQTNGKPASQTPEAAPTGAAESSFNDVFPGTKPSASSVVATTNAKP